MYIIISIIHVSYVVEMDLMADLQCCLCARDVYLSSVVLLISNILINDVGGGQHQYHYVYMHL